MKTFLILCLVFCSAYAIADDVHNALSDTQSLLRDSGRMQEEAGKTADGRKADHDATVVTLGKPELKQDLLNISADLMSWITESSKGDPEKMQQLLQEALNNPKHFFEKMPANERTRIKGLSEKIEGARQKNPYP